MRSLANVRATIGTSLFRGGAALIYRPAMAHPASLIVRRSATGRPSRPRRAGSLRHLGPAGLAAGLMLLVSLAAPPEARAHDYWLVPDPLMAPTPADVALALYVGDDFVAEAEKEMQPERIARFVHLHGESTTDLRPGAVAGARPFASLSGLGAGGHLVALDRTAAYIELGAAKFESYLREEGLDAIAGERAARGESDRPGRERYERFLKALVQIGEGRDETYRRVLGQTLEIVPGRDPTVAGGSALPVTVRFEGAPLAGARLERLTRRDGRIEKVAVTTGPDGGAEVPMPGDGIHLLRLVHMVRCEGCPGADWRSYWAACTFASGPAGVPRAVPAPPMLAPPPLWQAWWPRAAAAGAAAAAIAAVGWWRRRARTAKAPR